MTAIPRRHAIQLGAAALVGLPLLAASARRAHTATHQVQIQGFKFNPNTLSIAVGDIVVFTNNDGAPHTATANDDSFDTGRINRGNTGQITVATSGSHGFHCSFHPNMKGTITAA